MTTLHERMPQDDNQQPKMRIVSDETTSPRERRIHRRHDMQQQGIPVDRWDNKRSVGKSFGQIVDISAGGVRILASEAPEVKADGQIRIRLELPDYAGISPFIDNKGSSLEPKREWIGWMAVARVKAAEGAGVEIAGRLIDMDEIDRGMLGLYLCDAAARGVKNVLCWKTQQA